MARVAYFTEKEVAKARQLREQAKTATELRKALSLILVAEGGMSTDRAAELLGISERTGFRNQGYIRKQDESGKKSWGGRRRYTMTIGEELEFLRDWEAKAIEGGILSVPPIHEALVKKLGRSIPISTTYRMLARHGWRKVQPDTKHPRSAPELQEEYKKNSLRLWRPSA